MLRLIRASLLTCRYEVNPKIIEPIEQQGLSFVGQDDTGARQEIIEIKSHPYFVGYVSCLLFYVNSHVEYSIIQK
jgi:CTP synthase (UTP-ammonia lyase)